MFIELEEMKTVIYPYQQDMITESDDSIKTQAIKAAIKQAKSYLMPNNKKEWNDGRLRYDVDAVFDAEGDERDELIMEMTKNIAFFNLVRLCNADILYEKAKEMYDRAITWFRDVNKGNITLDLPLLDLDITEPDYQPFTYGSRLKFNHE